MKKEKKRLESLLCPHRYYCIAKKLEDRKDEDCTIKYAKNECETYPHYKKYGEDYNSLGI